MIRPTRSFLSLAGLSLAVALSGVAAAVAPVAAETGCKAKVMASGTSYSVLADAVAAAPGGTTIQVRGACLGPIVIDKNLTLAGKPSTVLGTPGIGGQESVRVLEIAAGKTVTVKDLEIAFGFAGTSTSGGSDETASRGGGILNRGRLTLTDVIVTENAAIDGAGIANFGTLLVNGTSRIHHNRSTSGGGGLFTAGTATLAGTTAVYGNTAGTLGGGIMAARSSAANPRLVLRDSAVVRDNTAQKGGGIATLRLPILLRDSASVKSNEASGDGGGIMIRGAGLTMEGRASVSGNTGGFGGGIFATVHEGKAPKVTLKASSVIKRNVGFIGAILMDSGSLTMLDRSSIRGHRDLTSVVTVAIDVIDEVPAIFTMKGSSIVTGNRVQALGAAVMRWTCAGDGIVPTFVGVKARTTGNSPKNVLTICP